MTDARLLRRRRGVHGTARAHQDEVDRGQSHGPVSQRAQLEEAFGLQVVETRHALAEAGLEEVDAAGKAFDPKLHEAISQEETLAVPEGQVIRKLRKGYKLRERLLRPASVVVAKQPAA